MSNLLLMDGNNLANRAWHTTGHITDSGERRMGVWFGMMETAHKLCNQYNTNDVIWFFDGGHAARSKLLPSYKADRKPSNKKEADDKADLWRQIDVMVDGMLADVGFNNVHKIKGHEADDLIARTVYDEPTDHDNYIIVSSDKDLYQLLMPHVRIYNAHTATEFTEQNFIDKYGLQPPQWAKVKAIVGGKEEIPGVPGVGICYAIQWLNKTLNPRTQTAAKIRAHRKQILDNYRLTVLPIDGTPHVPYTPNTLSLHKWRECCETLGFVDMIGRAPMTIKEVELPRRSRRGQ